MQRIWKGGVWYGTQNIKLRFLLQDSFKSWLNFLKNVIAQNTSLHHLYVRASKLFFAISGVSQWCLRFLKFLSVLLAVSGTESKVTKFPDAAWFLQPDSWQTLTLVESFQTDKSTFAVWQLTDIDRKKKILQLRLKIPKYEAGAAHQEGVYFEKVLLSMLFSSI